MENQVILEPSPCYKVYKGDILIGEFHQESEWNGFRKLTGVRGIIILADEDPKTGNFPVLKASLNLHEDLGLLKK